MDIKKKLKEIEKEEAQLALRKKALLDVEKQKGVLIAKLDAIVKQSEYASPKELVEALIAHYNIRVGGKRGSKPGTRRKRTTITAELRDEMKKSVKAGENINAVATRLGVSHAVVSKAVKGAYDKLKK